MARWEPNAHGRLREAAMELFNERGYEQTTVQEIAERAGLTARTFFRHFADKREVLFDGSQALEEAIGGAFASAPPDAPPMALVAATLEALAALIGRDRGFARRRQAAIDATAELQERELIKLARLATVLRGALRERGVPDADAGVAAETAIAIVRAAFARWLDEPEVRPLAEVMRESLARLEALVAGA
jgi:AcrR family transcriptional regulator